MPDRDGEGTSTDISTEQFLGGAGDPAGSPAAEAPTSPRAEEPAAGASLSTEQLLERLAADRLWLLQQIDGGHWSDLRLDLAALERELGQVLEQASQRVKGC